MHKKEKSFNVMIEQMAQLLRSELKEQEQKKKKRTAKRLATGAHGSSLSNTVEQIAKLLRTHITPSPKPIKKRTWSQRKKA